MVLFNIPSELWEDDTKLLSSQGAFLYIPRTALGMTEPISYSTNYNRKTKVVVNPIRSWEKDFSLSYLNMRVRSKSYNMRKSLDEQEEFIVYKSPDISSPIFYTPTESHPDIFVYCHELYFKPKVEPYKNRCFVTTMLDALLSIEYIIYREDLNDIRHINERLKSYIRGSFSTK